MPCFGNGLKPPDDRTQFQPIQPAQGSRSFVCINKLHLVLCFEDYSRSNSHYGSTRARRPRGCRQRRVGQEHVPADDSHAVSDGFPLPAPDNIIPRPLTSEEEARIDTLSRLQFVSKSYDSTKSEPGCTLMHCSSLPPPRLVGPMYPK